MRHITSQIRIYERDSRDEYLPLDHDKSSEHREKNEEDFWFQFLIIRNYLTLWCHAVTWCLFRYRNLDIINQTIMRKVQMIIRYEGIVFESELLAIRVRSLSESSSMKSASSDLATDVSLASSRIELTLLVSDSL